MTELPRKPENLGCSEEDIPDTLIEEIKNLVVSIPEGRLPDRETYLDWDTYDILNCVVLDTSAPESIQNCSLLIDFYKGTYESGKIFEPTFVSRLRNRLKGLETPELQVSEMKPMPRTQADDLLEYLAAVLKK